MTRGERLHEELKLARLVEVDHEPEVPEEASTPDVEPPPAVPLELAPSPASTSKAPRPTTKTWMKF
ncbi:hypothetical protein FOA52_014708 [Chlamydomonas sp. UWO 241]|nr:hypothetical protein FOA52_014708 [Chlamydomonas sp. UWO 241]